MAFFKFRKGGDEQPTPPTASESVEAMRKRAKHRLIGSAVLVLVGVVGFPLLFETQPRPIAVDIPIVIPDRNHAVPLPQASVVPSAAASTSAVTASSPSSIAPASGRTAPPASAAASSRVATGAVADAVPVEGSLQGRETVVPAAPPAAPTAHESVAATEKEAKTTPVTARFVVQIGAFSEVPKAREARLKVEKAGLKTYTQVVQSSEGKRIRVRVGPFPSKAEAEKAASKIKKLDLPASVLEL